MVKYTEVFPCLITMSWGLQKKDICIHCDADTPLPGTVLIQHKIMNQGLLKGIELILLTTLCNNYCSSYFYKEAKALGDTLPKLTANKWQYWVKHKSSKS